MVERGSKPAEARPEAPVIARGVGGLPRAKVRATVEGMAPKVDLFISASTAVNAARSDQCASLARPEDAPGPWRLGGRSTGAVVALSPAAVSRRKARALSVPEPPKVDFSLFVQLDADLPPEARAAAAGKVTELARRARWKADTAALEVSGEHLRDLHGIPGVSYVESGQTLRAPDPVVGDPTTAPAAALRQVTTASDQHRDGRGVLVGIIDVGGFDFAHADFRTGPRSTRWEAIWDQGGAIRPSPAARQGSSRFDALDYGSEIRKADMDRALAAAASRGMRATSLEPQSVMAVGSHGTHVASIAAGNLGVARRARLAGVLVALRSEDTEARSSFYDSTRIADAVDYLLALAAELGTEGVPLPVSINISLGTNGHAHDTSSAMARWIDNALSAPGRCVSVAAGNAGQVEPDGDRDQGYVLGRIHAGGRIAATDLRHELGWRVVGEPIVDVSENEMEIWYSAQDRFEVQVKPPGGGWIGPIQPGQYIRSEALEDGTLLSVYNETYYPANGANRISIVLSPFFGPEREDGTVEVGPIAAGVWRVRLIGKVVRDGRYDAWIERDDPRRLGGPAGRAWQFPSFFEPGTYTDDRMISSLACAERLLAVANVDVGANRAHVTSSRGPTRDGRAKPDIGADGTNVVAASGFDRERTWIQMTGTSMASPYVCGVAALMLAIAPRLTSAQILGIMRTTSAPLPGHDFAWRNDTGFGMVDADRCVAETLVHRQARQPDGRSPR